MSECDKSKSQKARGGSKQSRWDRDDSTEDHRRPPEEKIDPSSPIFSPLKALYASETKIPDPKAPLYDNLSKFESVLENRASTSKPKLPEKPLTYEDMPARDLTDTYENVKKWMRNAEGPMKVLHDCVERKIKVKIMTRGDVSIRGYVTGYIAAFDKLWNMAVVDATETWTRRKKKKIPALDNVSQDIPQDTAHLRMAGPIVKVTSVNKKTEKCERHVDKMLIRGEHVVTVSTLSY